MNTLLHHPVARLLGGLFSVAALVWLGLEGWRRWQDIGAAAPDAEGMATVLLFGIAYGLLLILLAHMWRRLVMGISDRQDLPARLLLRSYMVSQIGKYLPGNVAHFVGRHLMLTRADISQRALGKAVVAETLLLLGAAASVAALALAVLPGSLSFFGREWTVEPLLAALAGIALFIASPKVRAVAMGAASAIMPAAFGLALCFMAGLGTIFWLLVGPQEVAAGAAIAAALLAWMVGFLTPGSPGGIGTREAVIVALLGPLAPTASLLVAVALFRMVTVIGDLVCWLLPQLLWRAPDRAPEGP